MVNKRITQQVEQYGFTLIEVIVAMAILAVIGTLSYSSISQVVRSKEILETQSVGISRLQRAVTILERDFLQMMPRAVRTTFGGFEPAMTSDGAKVSFTRTGRKFIKGLPQPPHTAMSRVAYFLNGDKLMRETWPVLDRASSTVARRAVVLTGVTSFKVQLLDKGRQWQTTWPRPVNGQSVPLTDISLPRFVRFDIELKDLGTITRILPGAG